MDGNPIAIVGVSVELPSGTYSAENLDHISFFDFLLNSGRAYEDIPGTRFNVEAWKGTSLGTVHVNKGAFLKDIDLFDNVEFGISSKDAQAMAPATRKLLEHSFLALLDSGIDYRKKRVGVYTAGTSIELSNVAETDELEARGSFAGYPAMIANRISNHLDLLGPSIPVDTACSSTLTAMHLAIQGILNSDCEAAVVGGCQLNHRLVDWITYSQGSLLSKDGTCKPFDKSADGFSRAEGCIVVVVKPLHAAIQDYDRIYATIIGSAINSTGSGAPPGAPVAESQRDAMIKAYKRANRKPQDADFVELHATGTAKGDPTEANWVGASFQRDDELLVGSVKGNIGHTEITAFLASLSKALSILRTRVIPPTVGIKTLNPAISWDAYRMRVPTQPESLPLRGEKSLISIAGSGIGGSNGHVVLESPPVLPRLAMGTRQTSPAVLLVCGGLSNRTAVANAENINELVNQGGVDLPGLSTVWGRRTKQMTWRSFAIVPQSNEEPIIFSAPQHVPRDINTLVMVFSGQGPQHEYMGRQLFATFPVFRQSVLEMDEVFRRMTDRSIIHDHGLFAGQFSGTPDIWPISLTLPANCVFQIALFDLLVSFGIEPDVVIGHSAGETAVLYASGAAPKAMAVELAIIRGQYFTPIQEMQGTMAAVGCTPEEMEELIGQYRLRNESENENDVVEIACYNSPSGVAISGHESAVEWIVKLAESKSWFARKLRTKVPIHSSMMDKCREEYLGGLRQLFERYPGSREPTIPVYSTLTGQVLEEFDEEYFWHSTRQPVMFMQAISALLSTNPSSTFIEMGAHPALGSYISSMVDPNCPVFPTVSRPKKGTPSKEFADLLTLLGRLTASGHNCVNFTLLNSRACYETDVVISKYPFSKKRWPLYPDTPGYHRQIARRNGPLNYQYLQVNKHTHPSLADHVIRGEPIMPAAGFLEMAIEFGASVLMNVNMRSILSLSSEKPMAVNVQREGAYWTVTSSPPQANRESPTERRLHADGYLSFEPPPSFPDADISEIRKRCIHQISSKFYESLAYFSSYGRHFQRVNHVYYGVDEALVSITGLDQALASEGNYFLHPAILDACLQVSAYKPFHGDFSPNAYYLPSRVDSFIVHRELTRGYFPYHIYAHVEVVNWSPDSMTYDIGVYDDRGTRLCTFKGLYVARHHFQPVTEPSVAYEIVLQPPPDRLPLESENLGSGSGNPSNSPTTLLYVPEASFTFEYRYSHELDLQWDLSGLNAFQTLDVWILASVGRDGAAARGLLGALRKEYPAWTLRLVLFPDDFDEDKRIGVLSNLPASLESETNIQVTPEGDLRVPRIVTMELGPRAIQKQRLRTQIIRKERRVALPIDHIGIRVVASSKQSDVLSFVAEVTECNDTIYKTGSYVVGLTNSPFDVDEISVVDVIFVHHLSEHLHPSIPAIPSLISGFVAALLAPGISTFSRANRIADLRILVTHARSTTSVVIGEVYRFKGLSFTAIDEDVSLFDIANLQAKGPFDLIITEYDNLGYIQVLGTLLRERGRVFQWKELRRLIEADPCVVNDALQYAFGLMEDRINDIAEASGVLAAEEFPATPIVDKDLVLQERKGVSFDPRKTYILLGGIGTVGLHVALFMYQCGARHIVLTSRSGEASIEKNQNVVVRRMLKYLKTLDLNLRLVSADATSPHEMRTLMQTVSPARIGGCIILTGILLDRPFRDLSEGEFSMVYGSKIAVLEAIHGYLDVSSLEFVVGFSSVSGLIGIPGQTNYNAANAALEEEFTKYENGFAFVCPGVYDSTMMLAGAEEGREARLRRLIDWSFTAEDMVRWFEDAMRLFQNGHRFTRYIPALDWPVVERSVGMPHMGKHLVPPETTTSVTAVQEMDQMENILCSVLGIAPSDFSPDAPFTAYGIDSLSASKLSFQLRSIVHVTQIQLLANLSLNDLRRLKDASLSQKPGGSSKNSIDPVFVAMQKVNSMQKLVGRYAPGNVVQHRPSLSEYPLSTSCGKAVLLTGTTGALGTHILYRLLLDDCVTRVFALNRSSTSTLHERQQKALRDQGISIELASSGKLVLLEADFSRVDLGLDPEVLDQMLSSITDVIQNAWTVDFVSPLEDYEDLLLGTRNLLLIAGQALKGPRFTFMSTTGILRNRSERTLTLEEAPLPNPRLACATGYLESKWVGEEIVQIAGRNLGLRIKVVRAGVLSGSRRNGAWDPSHWVPALVQSGVYLGCLPEGESLISWVPVDAAAQSVIDILDADDEFIHIVHPRPVTWNSVMKALSKILGLPLVPYAEWLSRLEGSISSQRVYSSADHSDAKAAPDAALRLLHFFRLGVKTSIPFSDNTESMSLLPVSSSKKAIHVSKMLQKMQDEHQGIGEDDVRQWLDYWRSMGVII